MNTLTIGIAGTAKNTGKTTTTFAIMEQIKHKQDLILGLTSIGYDGEDLDNITGLPKPRIEVWPGVLVAVAEKCLAVSSAQIEILENTGINTPLGKLILGKVKKGGKLVVAGPNKSKELRQVLNKLRHHQSNFIIVDGALNRIAPMVEVDGLILTTGAARKPNIKSLALETHNIVQILQYPVLNSDEAQVRVGSILNKAAVDKMLEKIKNKQSVLIQNVMVEKGFVYLLEKSAQIKGKSLIFSDGIKLLVSGDINRMHTLLNELQNRQIEIGVQKSINVIAVTVNPYYPQYRFNSDDYQPAYIDREKLYQAIKEKVPVPVYDIFKQGGKNLVQNILDFRQNR